MSKLKFLAVASVIFFGCTLFAQTAQAQWGTARSETITIKPSGNGYELKATINYKFGWLDEVVLDAHLSQHTALAYWYKGKRYSDGEVGTFKTNKNDLLLDFNFTADVYTSGTPSGKVASGSWVHANLSGFAGGIGDLGSGYMLLKDKKYKELLSSLVLRNIKTSSQPKRNYALENTINQKARDEENKKKAAVAAKQKEEEVQQENNSKTERDASLDDLLNSTGYSKAEKAEKAEKQRVAEEQAEVAERTRQKGYSKVERDASTDDLLNSTGYSKVEKVEKQQQSQLASTTSQITTSQRTTQGNHNRAYYFVSAFLESDDFDENLKCVSPVNEIPIDWEGNFTSWEMSKIQNLASIDFRDFWKTYAEGRTNLHLEAGNIYVFSSTDYDEVAKKRNEHIADYQYKDRWNLFLIPSYRYQYSGESISYSASNWTKGHLPIREGSSSTSSSSSSSNSSDPCMRYLKEQMKAYKAGNKASADEWGDLYKNCSETQKELKRRRQKTYSPVQKRYTPPVRRIQMSPIRRK